MNLIQSSFMNESTKQESYVSNITELFQRVTWCEIDTGLYIFFCFCHQKQKNLSAGKRLQKIFYFVGKTFRMETWVYKLLLDRDC